MGLAVTGHQSEDLEKDVYRRDDGTLEATVARAVRDLRRVGRNVDLIDPETLADAITEEETHEQQSFQP
jgi:hypothetical protein